MTTRLTSVAIIVLASGLGPTPRWLGVANLSMDDGGWYKGIAMRGYPSWNEELNQSGYPFFPFYPWTLRFFGLFDVPYGASGPAVAMLAFALGLWGVFRLARRHASPTAAPLAVWALALFPMTAVFSMAYPSGIMLASSVWAVYFAETRRDWLAGVLAAIAALSRPIGCAVIVALALQVWPERRRLGPLVAPAAMAVATWLAVLWWWTGDPLIFITAKKAWQEATIADVLTLRTDDASAYVHLMVAVAGLTAVTLAWRRLPRAWLVFVALYILPSCVFGVSGMGRSTSECFPVVIAIAMLLERVSDRSRYVYFAATAAVSIAITFAFAIHTLLP